MARRRRRETSKVHESGFDGRGIAPVGGSGPPGVEVGAAGAAGRGFNSSVILHWLSAFY
jgi:hypothetical protein